MISRIFLRLFLLFTVVPAVELGLLLWLGSQLGPLPTLAIVLVTGVVGAWFAKREGLGVLTQLRNELSQGLPSTERVTEGVMVLVGGLLLVTPGVMTDLVGFSLILPWSRRWLAPRVLRYFAGQMNVQVVGNVRFAMGRICRLRPRLRTFPAADAGLPCAIADDADLGLRL